MTRKIESRNERTASLSYRGTAAAFLLSSLAFSLAPHTAAQAEQAGEAPNVGLQGTTPPAPADQSLDAIVVTCSLIKSADGVGYNQVQLISESDLFPDL